MTDEQIVAIAARLDVEQYNALPRAPFMLDALTAGVLMIAVQRFIKWQAEELEAGNVPVEIGEHNIQFAIPAAHELERAYNDMKQITFGLPPGAVAN